jgi:propionate CoA-transferase
MSKPTICTAEQAVSDIQDGQTVASVGVIGWITPDRLLRALGERFAQSATPRGLTFYFPCAAGDAMDIPGMEHVAREGLMRRLVSGSYINSVHPQTGRRPEVMRLIRENKIEAYAMPIGASMHWLREVARKSPGYITRVGLGTYIDPELTGGCLTEQGGEPIVERIELRGETFLFYPTRRLDVGLLRATSADELGNLSFEEEPIISSNIQMAMAVKACGGQVIAQVKRIVPVGSRPAHAVQVPGVLVDKVVVDPEQVMVTGIAFDASYLGPDRAALDQLPRIPAGADKVIARRAAREIPRGELSIFGFGASSDTPLVMAEEGMLDGDHGYWFTTEHGSYGGVVMSGWQFSANVNPLAHVDGVTQFDLIDGGLCTCGVLAFAQFDAAGNVNVSRFGSANPGAGGFIDIAQNARKLLFCGGFTTAGLRVAFPGEGGTLQIEQEGKVQKFVREAEHLTYGVQRGVRERGQQALVITERAVFEITPEGYVLIEVAPGIDVRTQILDRMQFAPVRILDPLPRMDARLFH